MNNNLFENFDSFPDNIAFITKDNQSITYAEFIFDLKIFQDHLREGALLLIVADISYETILCYVAAMLKKTVVMFVDKRINLQQVTSLIEKYRPDFIFSPHDFHNENIKKYSKEHIDFGDHFLLRRSEENFHQINKNLALLLPTSGSLGGGKYVRISHHNIFSNTQSIVRSLRINRSDRAITTMPIEYSYMLSIINTHLHVGASIVICNHSVMEKNFWKTARLHRITSLSGVPIFYHMLIKLGLENMKLPSLRQLTQAGGKLGEEVIEKIIDFSEKERIEFRVMYGQTEASPRISCLDSSMVKLKLGSIGKAIPNVHMWLETLSGDKICEANTVGEVVVSGPNVCMGYAENYKHLSRGDVNGGSIRTGDLAYKDTDGFFYISGRLKRIAKIDGFRLNLDEVENRMKARGFFLACLESNNKIQVFFDKSIDLVSISSILPVELGMKKTYFSFYQLDSLPLTGNDKINYKKLRDLIFD